MEKVCDPLFSRNVKSTSDFVNSNTEQRPKKPWFDDECRSSRKSFYSALKFYRPDKSYENQTRLVSARAEYKKTLRQNVTKTCKLLVSESKNVKENWKLLKQSANLNNKCSIDAKKFSEYFQSISDPNDRFYQPDEDTLYFNEIYMQGELQVMFEELNLPILFEEIKKGVWRLYR